MNDYIIRAIAANDQIRAFAAVTTETVETARQDHNTSPVATAALGRLLTAGAMMGTMMKGDKDILTLQIKAGGPLEGITVTADSKGRVKGYVGNPGVCIPANSKGKLDVAGAIRQTTAGRVLQLYGPVRLFSMLADAQGNCHHVFGGTNSLSRHTPAQNL